MFYFKMLSWMLVDYWFMFILTKDLLLALVVFSFNLFTFIHFRSSIRLDSLFFSNSTFKGVSLLMDNSSFVRLMMLFSHLSGEPLVIVSSGSPICVTSLKQSHACLLLMHSVKMCVVSSRPLHIAQFGDWIMPNLKSLRLL